jgi:adenosylcobinamide-phosphate synthase
MSSGAGALGVQLGGPAIYHGEVEHRPPLGVGEPATGADISRAWQLVVRTTALWLALACAVAAVVEVFHA